MKYFILELLKSGRPATKCGRKYERTTGFIHPLPAVPVKIQKKTSLCDLAQVKCLSDKKNKNFNLKTIRLDQILALHNPFRFYITCCITGDSQTGRWESVQ